MRSEEIKGDLACSTSSCSAARCLSSWPKTFCRLKGSLSVRSAREVGARTRTHARKPRQREEKQQRGKQWRVEKQRKGEERRGWERRGEERRGAETFAHVGESAGG